MINYITYLWTYAQDTMLRNHTEQADSTSSVNKEGHLTFCQTTWSRLQVIIFFKSFNSVNLSYYGTSCGQKNILKVDFKQN